MCFACTAIPRLFAVQYLRFQMFAGFSLERNPSFSRKISRIRCCANGLFSYHFVYFFNGNIILTLIHNLKLFYMIKSIKNYVLFIANSWHYR